MRVGSLALFLLLTSCGLHIQAIEATWGTTDFASSVTPLEMEMKKKSSEQEHKSVVGEIFGECKE